MSQDLICLLGSCFGSSAKVTLTALYWCLIYISENTDDVWPQIGLGLSVGEAQSCQGAVKLSKEVWKMLF